MEWTIQMILKLNSKFLVQRELSIVLTFDFYDGPESGIALFESGEAFRFSLLVDSRFNCFRCFDFSVLEGNWWPVLNSLEEVIEAKAERTVVVVPQKESKYLTDVQDKVMRQVPVSHALGIGSPYFKWMKMAPISAEQLQISRSIIGTFERYKYLHKLLKMQSAR